MPVMPVCVRARVFISLAESLATLSYGIVRCYFRYVDELIGE